MSLVEGHERNRNRNQNQNQNISFGPWGGQDGARWDDGVYSGVTQVVISHGDAIDSIQVKYYEKGCSIWSDRHGGTDGCKTDKIKLDFPQEFLMSISGSYGYLTQLGPILVRSLSFESNRKKYGPFGTQGGTHFPFPVTSGKIIGFHGRCSSHLDSIGVYLKPLLQQQNQPYIVADKFGYTTAAKQLLTEGHGELNHKVSIPYYTDKETLSSDVIWPVKYGPWGGDGGMIFDDGIFTGVREVHIMRNGGGVVSIKVCYDKNGQALWGNRHGGKGGLRLDEVAFEYPSEILTHISGYYGSSIFMGPTVAVRSLTFHTTKRKYGPFGEEQGIFFSSGSRQRMIVGFHGRKGWLVDSIGVHVLEGGKRPPTIDAFNMSDQKTEVIGYVLMVKGTSPVGLGPWGGDGGKPWDDGAFSGVKQIYLTEGSDAICTIEIQYDRNGQSIWSTRHGGGGGYTHKMKFEYPHEVLTRVSGYYGPIPGDGCTKVIRSLTFFTNRASYGPFGEETGTFFGSTTEGKVVGFHGRSGSYLEAIGVHMQHISGDRGLVNAVLNKMF